MTIESPKPPKRSIARKVSFWAEFIGSLGALLFKGADDKKKVMDIANGISQTADIVVQVQEGESPFSVDANSQPAPPNINGETPPNINGENP